MTGITTASHNTSIRVNSSGAIAQLQSIEMAPAVNATTGTTSLGLGSGSGGRRAVVTESGSKHSLDLKDQKQLLVEETTDFFTRHHIRFKKHDLPLHFPPHIKDIHSIVAEGKEFPPYTTIYRHMCNFKQRVLSNWSYIRTEVNTPDHPRNKNIPFNLRELNKNIHSQLDSMAKDLNDKDFTGVLLTLHTHPFKHPGLPADQPLSKVVGGALIEGLESNERCIKTIWLHPNLNTYATRVILQVFIPRILVEAFDIHIENIDGASNDFISDGSDHKVKGETPIKFVYAMHDDLDMFPRQAWIFLASSKYFRLKRHYESSAAHNVFLDYSGMHTDVQIIKDEETADEGAPSESSTSQSTAMSSASSDIAVIGITTGNQVSNSSNSRGRSANKANFPKVEEDDVCECVKSKQKCKQSFLLERLIGCSEEYMHRCLPTLDDRKKAAMEAGTAKISVGRSSIHKRKPLEMKKGWRDFIPSGTDPLLIQQASQNPGILM